MFAHYVNVCCDLCRQRELWKKDEVTSQCGEGRRQYRVKVTEHVKGVQEKTGANVNCKSQMGTSLS